MNKSAWLLQNQLSRSCGPFLPGLLFRELVNGQISTVLSVTQKSLLWLLRPLVQQNSSSRAGGFYCSSTSADDWVLLSAVNPEQA